MITTLIAAPADGGFNPAATGDNIQTLLLVILGLVLIYVSVKTIATKGSKGDMKGSTNATGATVVGMIPAIIGLALVAFVAFGSGFLAWLIPGITG